MQHGPWKSNEDLPTTGVRTTLNLFCTEDGISIETPAGEKMEEFSTPTAAAAALEELMQQGMDQA